MTRSAKHHLRADQSGRAELSTPTPAVRESYLAGELELYAEEGTTPSWLGAASQDFGQFAAVRAAPQRMWDVPVTELWYLRGTEYLGTVMIRHELTPSLLYDGGNIGYHVVPGHRRQGHATAMLAAACDRCRRAGMSRVLLTCRPDNLGSRRVIEANGGVLDSADELLRYWIAL